MVWRASQHKRFGGTTHRTFLELGRGLRMICSPQDSEAVSQSVAQLECRHVAATVDASHVV